MALSERQQEIKALIEQGNKVSAIATQLGITPNGVYQQLRRMRESGDAPATSTKKTGAKTKTTAKANATSNTSTGTTANVTVTTTGQAKALRPLTPLQAIRARRDEIMSDIKGAQAEQEAAQRALVKATEAVDKLAARHSEELGRINSAEAALTGKPVAGQPTVQATVRPAPQGKPASATTPRPTSGARSGSKSGSENGASAASDTKAVAKASAPPAAPQAAPTPAPAPDSPSPAPVPSAP